MLKPQSGALNNRKLLDNQLLSLCSGGNLIFVHGDVIIVMWITVVFEIVLARWCSKTCSYSR